MWHTTSYFEQIREHASSFNSMDSVTQESVNPFTKLSTDANIFSIFDKEYHGLLCRKLLLSLNRSRRQVHFAQAVLIYRRNDRLVELNILAIVFMDIDCFINEYILVKLLIYM